LGVDGNIPISGIDNSEWMSLNNLLTDLYYVITYVFPYIYYLWFLAVDTNDVHIVGKLVGVIQS